MKNSFKDLRPVPGLAYWAMSIYVHLRLLKHKIENLFKDLLLVLVSVMFFWATLIYVLLLHLLKTVLANM